MLSRAKPSFISGHLKTRGYYRKASAAFLNQSET
jgi:hypothetical protein